MTLRADDPKLTAHALGEFEALAPEERLAIERELARDPALRQAADAIRSTAALLSQELAREPVLELSELTRAAIQRAAEQPARRAAIRWRRWWPAAGLAAGAAVVLLGVAPWRRAPTPVVVTSARVPTVVAVAGPVATGSVASGEASAERQAGMDEAHLETSPDSVDGDQDGYRYGLNGARVSGNKPVLEDSVDSSSVYWRTSDEGDEANPAMTPRAGSSHSVPAKVGGVGDSPSEARWNRVGRAGGGNRGHGKAGPLHVRRRGRGLHRNGMVGNEVELRGEDSETEQYAHSEDHPFIAVADDPLSTFSIDVDTASYSNVRRILRQGLLPPVDAVRIEEMINYFDYDYAPPRDGSPLAAHVEVAPAPWNPGHQLVRIGLKGRELDASGRPPSNLVFLIDVSGSMKKPDKLPLLQRALTRLVMRLGARDRVAIVTYAGSSGLVLPSTAGDQRDTILTALQTLRARGATNGGAGIELAYRVAADHFIAGGVNRVVLATDGDFNGGKASQGSLVRLVQERARGGVALTVLGFGKGNYNDATLELLADRGDGNYAYIDSADEAERVLVEQIDATLVTVARDVKVQVEFNPERVARYRLIGYEDRALAHREFNDDRRDAGELGAGHEVTALYELEPVGATNRAEGMVDALRYQGGRRAPEVARPGELMTVKLRYKEPGADESRRLEFPVLDAGRDLDHASADFRFAAATAAFAMLLRGSSYRGDYSYADVVELIAGNLGADPGGQRAELLGLVRTVRRIVGR